jgi:hypothetical protein
MEISDIVYLAFATIMVVVVLHIGVFWVSRMIQPPKPKIVYVDRTPIHAIQEQVPPPPQPQPIGLPPRIEPPAIQSPPSSQTINVPTYTPLPLPIVQTNKADAQLPPPIETRETDKVGWSGGKS